MRRLVFLSGVLVAAALALGPVTASGAGWSSTGSGSGSSKAQMMPVGSTPSASVSGRNVTITWTASALSGGVAVIDYAVKRYDAAGGAAHTIGSGCSGTVTSVTCTETAVPPGSWRYSVTPVKGGWAGGESPRSTSVAVGSPTLSLTSSTTLTSLPATLSGNVANFVTGATLAFRLDDPTSGTLLSGSFSPTPIPGDGSAAISVTIPAGVGNGSHNVYAIEGTGSSASASITVNVDTQPPTVSSSTVAKTQGGSTGYVKQGGSYHVYANVIDPGSPATGVATVTADVSSITAGNPTVALQSGSFSIGGQSYNYRSASLTAKNPLAEGAHGYSITSTDNAGNSGTESGFTVTGDNTAPTALDIQTTNAGGGTVGKPEAGDTITFGFNEVIDPDTLLSGWTGSSTAVIVRLIDGGVANDVLQIWNAANSSQLPLGQVDLGRNDYTLVNATFSSSTMNASAANVTITLGAPSTTLIAVTGNGTMSWTPSSAATDRAGNACSTASATESGPAGKDF